MNAGSGAMLYYFRYVALQEILRLKLDHSYTHVVITRSDYLYTAPHPTKVGADSLWIPRGEDYGGITDRHTVIPMSMAVPALNIVEEMVTRDGTDILAHYGFQRHEPELNPEKLLKHYYETEGLKVTRFPRVMFSVRDTDDTQATTWQKGTRIEEFASNVLVKYITEYTASLATAYELSACASGCLSVDSCAWTAARSTQECEQLPGCSNCVSEHHRCIDEYIGFNTGTKLFSVPKLEKSEEQFSCSQVVVSSFSATAARVLATNDILITDADPRVVAGNMRESGEGTLQPSPSTRRLLADYVRE